MMCLDSAKAFATFAAKWLVAAALVLACQSAEPPQGTPLPEDGSRGTVRLQMSLQIPAGAKAVRVKVVGASGEHTQVVPFENHGLPPAVDSNLAARPFADALFVLRAGSYDVTAVVIDAAGAPLPNCAEGKQRVTVVPTATTEISLALTCLAPGNAGLDVAVALNTQPSINSLQIGGGKFVCSHEAAQIVVGASDPDGDTVTLKYSVNPEGAKMPSFCLASDPKLAVFAAQAPGTYHITVEASDGKGPAAKLTFPLHVSDCQGPPVCQGKLVGAAMPNPVEQHGQCTCEPPAFPTRLHEPQGVGFDVMPPYVKNSPSVLVKRQGPFKGDVACPSLGEWKGETLTTFTAPKSKATQVHCGYRWQSAQSPNYELLKDLGSPSFACDQPALSPTGAEALPADVWQSLRDLHRQRTGWVPGLASQKPNPVRVAVLDSAVFPYDDDRRELYGHGRAVGRTIADLACVDPGSAQCAQQIRNYLTLDRVHLEAPPDRERGGYYADFQGLATQIHAALNDWVADGGAEPLVMNLSLGWDKRHVPYLNDFRDLRTDPGDCPRDEPALLEEVVQVALERASCLGALVVAAAGNEDNPGYDRGPFLPAGWEALPAVEDPARCASFLPPGWTRGAANPSPSSAAYRPLVFAAMGAGQGHLILGNSRAEGKARLAGAGMGVVTSESRSGGPSHTMTLSGSSMAAATVSGVAAAAWAVNRNVDSFQVMQWLYDTGFTTLLYTGAVDLLDFSNADFARPGCVDHTCRRTRSVQFCQAVSAAGVALGRAPWQCPPRVAEPDVPTMPDGLAAGMDESDVSPIPPGGAPVWGLHLAPWIRPAPSPFGCLPGYCTLDIYNLGFRFGYFAGAYDAPQDTQIYATQVHLQRPFQPVDTRLVFYNAPGYTPVPTNNSRFLVYLSGVDNLYVSSLTNWVVTWNGSGLLTHTEVIAVINR